MAQPTTGHVFMSYSRRDEAVMQRIATLLRKDGIKVWVDNEKLVPGTPIWEAEIEKAIKAAMAIVVIMSPDSKDSVWVRREISLAEQYRKRIFPVMVRGNEDLSVSLRLVTSQYVDIRQKEGVGLDALKTELSRYLKELESQEKPEGKEAAKEVPIPDSGQSKRQWKIGKIIVLIMIAVVFLMGIIFGRPLFYRLFPTEPSTPGNTPTSAPNPLSSSTAALTATKTNLPPGMTAIGTCPHGNYPPNISLDLMPRSVNIYETAELTITINDPENDPYEILAVIAEFGRFPNGLQKPYLYDAPSFPETDVITVIASDGLCLAKAEIIVAIQE